MEHKAHFSVNGDLSLQIGELLTLRDMVRYAVTIFSSARLHHGHGSGTAVDEAVFLVSESLNLPADHFEGFADARLTASEKEMLAQHIALRVQKKIPTAYILGRTCLANMRFRSDPRALIPRSLLAELLFSSLFDGSGEDFSLIPDPHSIHFVLDLCTGGGSLAILAAQAFPNACIDACDCSQNALELARENIHDHHLESRVKLYQGDLYAPVSGRRYDLILSNPPYVSRKIMKNLPAEYSHEPACALDGGEDGMDLVRRILNGRMDHLNAGGGLLCEAADGKAILLNEYPELPFVWLETAESKGDVFWLGAPLRGEENPVAP